MRPVAGAEDNYGILQSLANPHTQWYRIPGTKLSILAMIKKQNYEINSENLLSNPCENSHDFHRTRY